MLPVVFLLVGAGLSPGATIALTNSDALGTTSFNTGLNWAGGAAPTSGNAYQTSTFLLRTPLNAASLAFAGDLLEVQSGGSLRDKTAAIITITNLICLPGTQRQQEQLGTDRCPSKPKPNVSTTFQKIWSHN